MKVGFTRFACAHSSCGSFAVNSGISIRGSALAKASSLKHSLRKPYLFSLLIKPSTVNGCGYAEDEAFCADLPELVVVVYGLLYVIGFIGETKKDIQETADVSCGFGVAEKPCWPWCAVTFFDGIS